MASSEFQAQLAWWLEAHMSLASDLVRLQQLRDGLSRKGRKTERIRLLAVRVERVRDALYGLYWRSSDVHRMLLAGGGRSFERDVQHGYDWCSRTIARLRSIALEVCDGTSPDWGALARELDDAAEFWLQRVERLVVPARFDGRGSPAPR